MHTTLAHFRATFRWLWSIKTPNLQIFAKTRRDSPRKTFQYWGQAFQIELDELYQMNISYVRFRATIDKKWRDSRPLSFFFKNSAKIVSFCFYFRLEFRKDAPCVKRSIARCTRLLKTPKTAETITCNDSWFHPIRSFNSIEVAVRECEAETSNRARCRVKSNCLLQFFERPSQFSSLWKISVRSVCYIKRNYIDKTIVLNKKNKQNLVHRAWQIRGPSILWNSVCSSKNDCLIDAILFLLLSM